MNHAEFRPDRILIIRTSAIGDVIHGLPVLSLLRQSFPSAKLVWVAEEHVAPILASHPHLDELILLNTRRWRRNWKSTGEVFSFLKKCRSHRPDIAIDIQGLMKSALIAWLSGARVRIGFTGRLCKERAAALLYNKRIDASKFKHVVDMNLALLEPLGVRDTEPEFHLHIEDETKSKAKRFVEKLGGKPVVINPGATWKTKEWGAENYASVAGWIAKELKKPVVITWGPGERSLAEKTAEAAGDRIMVAPPINLQGLMALLSESFLFIGPDTGPMHIAAALGLPVVALFGPTDPERNGPYNKDHIIIHHQLDCSNCYKRSCGNPVCIRSIKPTEVIDAVIRLIERLKTRGKM